MIYFVKRLYYDIYITIGKGTTTRDNIDNYEIECAPGDIFSLTALIDKAFHDKTI